MDVEGLLDAAVITIMSSGEIVSSRSQHCEYDGGLLRGKVRTKNGKPNTALFKIGFALK